MTHPENDQQYKGLSVQKGIAQPPITNPYKKRYKKKIQFSPEEYVEGILKGDR
ncbi:MAG: methylmalonyl Co-A mutase-associated GTPase MeaB, partial [Bacteroidales bacterium]|nr:methylmalonyl Co-A mutase-associated GTPase MeaB [Bacteroidales bacterium]